MSVMDIWGALMGIFFSIAVLLFIREKQWGMIFLSMLLVAGIFSILYYVAV